MCAVHDDCGHNLFHVGNVAEVNYQVVVAETVASLCEPYFLGTALQSFLYRIFHISATEELCFLYIYRLTCMGSSHQEIGLSAQKGWYLQYVAHLSCCLCLITLVNIGRDA